MSMRFSNKNILNMGTVGKKYFKKLQFIFHL